MLERIDHADRLHVAAISSLLVLTAAYVHVLYEIAAVVGVSTRLLIVVLLSIVTGLVAADRLTVRTTTLVTGLLLVLGVVAYLQAIPDGFTFVVSLAAILRDLLILLSGLSVLHLVAISTWVVAFVPAPVFCSVVLVTRGRYISATAIGSVALGMLVLTGDATVVQTTVGVVGAAGVVGFGELNRSGGTPAAADLLAFTLSVMLLVSLLAGAVTWPGIAGLGTPPASEPSTLDGALVGADDELAIVGSVDLSPSVRYTIVSDEPGYWRADAYDRYTGNGWIRTGSGSDLTDLGTPPGPTRTVSQTVTAESRVLDMPVRWQPTELTSQPPMGVTVSPEWGLRPQGALTDGDTYTAISHRPAVDSETLTAATGTPPDAITDRYTQLPDSTPDRVGDFTAELVADADTDYERTRIIEQYLRTSKDYSLTVDRPEGDIADAFLFEMEAGYCTYFATTMVAMLRTQGIPARLAVGYSTGEAIDNNQYVVRGSDAHAWVEVYFDGVGWIEFEPTPPSERASVHDTAVEDARDQGDPDVDTAESEPDDTTPDPLDEAGDDDPVDPIDPAGADDDGALADFEPPTGYEDDSGFGAILIERIPDPGRIALILIGVIGIAAGVRRSERLSGIVDRIVPGRTRHRPTPEDRVNTAYDRVQRHVRSTVRAKRTGESERVYLETVTSSDVADQVQTLLDYFERAKYGSGVDRFDALKAEVATETILESVERPFRS